ncbi:hypothetical protein TNCV_1249541 [Trichonephila clavipes]|nr:hypothetical protein TNCV_1249541 [Trichonephila clavipes]
MMDFNPSSTAINPLLSTEQFSGLRLESRIESFSMKALLPVRFDPSLLPSVYINMASLEIPFLTSRASCRRFPNLKNSCLFPISGKTTPAPREIDDVKQSQFGLLTKMRNHLSINTIRTKRLRWLVLILVVRRGLQVRDPSPLCSGVCELDFLPCAQ